MPLCRWLLLALALAAPACDREPKAAPAARTGQKASALAAPAASELDELPWKLPAAERVVAFGDLHGDAAAARAVLILVGAMSEEGRWIGGKTVVVATGDQMDRSDDERRLFELLADVSRQASAAGGAVHVLSGNHEVLNVAGHFDYVSEQGFAQFSDVERPELGEALALFPPEARGRAAAFLPGGPYARRLARWPVVVQVGDTVFVHGGLLPEHLAYGIGQINRDVRRWMNGHMPRLPEMLRSMRAPYWVRLYSSSELENDACPTLSQTLSSLGARRMVVGHTPQKRINAACDEQVWRIDVGLSRFYGTGRVEALEIRGNQVQVLSAKPSAGSETPGGEAKAKVIAE
ncbi:MAG: metallophosphoesterase [Polyangiaceae bacterium]|nr:metallophosphoesterase [Polyangiaceae bacterium]